MATKEVSTDVLVIGGGPVSIFAANVRRQQKEQKSY